MKRIIWIIGMMILFFGNAATARTYKIGIVSWVGWSPAVVAEVKGFWKAQGIDVKVAVLPDPIAVGNLFNKKLIDIRFDMIGSAAGYYMDGMPITVIAETDWSHGADEIIIKKDLDVSNSANLKGMPVGVYLNQPPVAYFLNKYLSAIGLKLSDIRIFEMEITPLTDNFIGDRFKMIVSYDPEASRAEKAGNGTMIVNSAAYEGCMPEGMMALKEVLKDIPNKDLSKIFKGWIKAVQWMQDEKNWKAYVEIVNNTLFKDDAPYSEALIKEMLKTARIHDIKTQTERNRNGGGLETYLKELRAFLAENNMLKKDFQPADIFDNKFILEALKTVE